MHAVHVLNGPNLNLVGTREPAIYGSVTLADIEARCRAKANALGMELAFSQTNHEGELITRIQEAGRAGAGIVLNAGALTHTSIGVHDAIRGVDALVVEVHLSNVHARERFRHRSFVSPVAKGVIVGLGPFGYEAAIEALARLFAERGERR
jgi:3-dehydroquinate dehydratase-2